MNISGYPVVTRFFLAVTLFSAGLMAILSCDQGKAPIAPYVAPDDSLVLFSDSADVMRIRAFPADDNTGAAIEIVAFDMNHNPLVGKEIRFTATSGMVSAVDTTGVDGMAFAKFTADPQSGDAVVIAAMEQKGVVFTVSTIVRSSGAGIIADIDSVNKNMRMHALPSALRASYKDHADITVTVFDDNRNPIVGREVLFSSTLGIITGRDTTNEGGVAQVVFTAEPLNGDAMVQAKMTLGDSMVSVATTVTMSGVALVVVPQLASAPKGVTVPVTVKLFDGAGEPMPDREVMVVASESTMLTTNGNGEVITSVTRSSEGRIIIRAAALGATDSASVYFGTAAPVDIDNTIRSLRLFSSHAQLRADNSAETQITAVIISSDNHNPLIGDTVQFSANLGIIDEYGITDGSGRATVTLRSAPVNGNCVVSAVLASSNAIADSTTVLFSGVTLELAADREELRINDTALVQALLKDGSGNPISSDVVTFSTLTPAEFSDGTRLQQASLSATGTAVVKATSGTSGSIMVHAVSANVADSLRLTFTTNNLSVVAERAGIIVGGADSTRITARYRNKSGNPIEGKIITFAVNAGSLTELTATTNSSGNASTYLKSGYFAGEATVQAKSPDGSAYTSVRYLAAKPGAIALTVTPDNIGVNGGIATLVATVMDDSGNVVSGAEVSFKILKGPGGGEQIEKPIIVSTNSGVARSQLLAGSLPSTYRGCEVEATVAGIAAATKLTISGEPHTVTVSRPEDDTVKVPNAGVMDESTFDFFIGAVVKDVNGNPVADGTPVNFSAVVSGMEVAVRAFDHWSGVESTDDEMKPVYRWEFIDVPFEDMNANFRFDEGIDLKLDEHDAVAARGDDVNGDGAMEYIYGVHDFIWPFTGAEPYWASSVQYTRVTDSLQPGYITPKTTITKRVEMIIDPLVASDGSSVIFDTTYAIEFDTVTVYPAIDSTYAIFADLNKNGKWDRSPYVELNGDTNSYFMPSSGDFEYWRWEMRPHFMGQQLDFSDNDVAMVVDRTAVTKDGVAYTRITYPRQMANRIIATVNAEVKGIRDKDGERFTLPVLR